MRMGMRVTERVTDRERQRSNISYSAKVESCESEASNRDREGRGEAVANLRSDSDEVLKDMAVEEWCEVEWSIRFTNYVVCSGGGAGVKRYFLTI